ncbi:unnamed protein product [Diabrotica balteata]|uniref:Uncharacterized protein n=1 Tax=Diabrotica balteata TaxID=107213 RepID=A0A9N9XHF0_DIABA|nr:unnamed protein product [Diabrotica balteata]
MGSPVFPDTSQRKKMRQVEAPLRLFSPTDLKRTYLQLDLTLNMPSVHLIQVCSKSDTLPKRLENLNLEAPVPDTLRLGRHFLILQR